MLDAAGTRHDIARMLRRNVWARAHDGVYVNHTGRLTWDQRAWAALLSAWPAALDASSALRSHGLTGSLRPPDGADIEVAVHESRRVTPPKGVRVRRIADYDAIVQAHLSPPRVRVERAVLVVASSARTDGAAVAVVADACQSGVTTPARLAKRMDKLGRLRRRNLLAEILLDVSHGAFSALERRYLDQVERAHGLPRGVRQERVEGETGVLYRDVLYSEFDTAVELDGRLGHEWSADRWSDLDRDVAAAADGVLTVRLGWKQVLEPCRLAGSIARILRSRGWQGQPSGCSPTCPLNDGASDAPGAPNPPLLPAA